LSNPKSAAITFLKAIAAGDIKTANSSSVGNDQQRASVEALSLLITGLRDFDIAINSHFRIEAIQTDTQLRQALTDISDTPIQRIESGIVHETAEKASVEPALEGIRLKAHPPIYLIKVKNLWKVDLTAAANADRRFSPDVTDQYRSAGRALHDVARKVNANKYKSLAEAQRDADGNMP
jgi:hypothetical protein